jgi:multisubunit Na+/H+ antiporter MnhB subunit
MVRSKDETLTRSRCYVVALFSLFIMVICRSAPGGGVSGSRARALGSIRHTGPFS